MGLSRKEKVNECTRSWYNIVCASVFKVGNPKMGHRTPIHVSQERTLVCIQILFSNSPPPLKLKPSEILFCITKSTDSSYPRYRTTASLNHDLHGECPIPPYRGRDPALRHLFSRRTGAEVNI